MKRFRVAFSFSGSMRSRVEPVAEILEIRHSREEILYDKFHEAEFARDRLDVYLQRLYFDESDLIVVFLCDDYADHDWCGLEWDAIRSTMKTDPSKVLLCAENADVKVPGLYRRGVYLIRDRSATDIARAIKSRHAQATFRPPSEATLDQSEFHLDEIGFPVTETNVVRPEQLSKLLEELQPRARPWGVLLDGESGAGKTTLAIKAARTQTFFRTAIYLTAKAESSGFPNEETMGLSALYRVFDDLLSKMNAENASRLPPDERIILASSLLAEQGSILVFDNLEYLNDSEIARLKEFLRFLPFTCKALAICSRPIELLGPRIRLEALRESQSNTLIEGFMESSSENRQLTTAERIELIGLSGGNPTVLKLLIGQWQENPTLSVSDILTQGDHQDRLATHFMSLSSTFSLDEKLLLAMLAVVDEPIGVNQVPAFFGGPRGVADLTLDRLTQRRLVLRDGARLDCHLPGSVVALVRRYFSEEVAEASLRLANFSEAKLLMHADDSFGLNSELDSYWPVISSVWSKVCDFPSDRVQRLCDASRNYLNFTGKWDARIQICEAGEVKAVADSNFLAAGRRAYDVAMVHFRRGEYARSLELADKIERYYADLREGQGGVALADRVRGLAYRKLGDYGRAIYFGLLSVSGFSREVEGRDLACAVNALAVSQAEAGKLNEAREGFERAIEIAERIGASDYVADYKGNLADIPIKEEDWDTAEAIVSSAMPLSQAIGRRELVARNYLRMARISLGRDEASEAFDQAMSAQSIFDSIGMPQANQARELAAQALRANAMIPVNLELGPR